jgi:hypothetical protein
VALHRHGLLPCHGSPPFWPVGALGCARNVTVRIRWDTSGE